MLRPPHRFVTAQASLLIEGGSTMIAHDTRSRRHAAQPLASGQRRDPAEDKTEERIDEALEETFPASDPIAAGGPTRIDPAKPTHEREPRTPPASRSRHRG
jgi:hypothetical protein